MNSDVARAIEDLSSRAVLSEVQAALPRRVARGELVSVHFELRAALYGGVLLVTAAAGLLLKENLTAIGPMGIALGLGIVATFALVWVARASPAFSWEEVPSPNLAFDYILLLGVTLAASDLAYVEVQFTPLGPSWPWHLLVVAILTAVLAARYDSRLVFSLSLASFAAWRGVSGSFLEWKWWDAPSGAVRLNMLGCGVFFVLLGAALAKAGRKAHFEPVAGHLGWLLILGSLTAGVIEGEQGSALGHSALLLITAAALSAWSIRGGRFSLFAIGVLGSYVGISGLVLRGFHPLDEVLVMGWFALSALGLLGALVMGHLAMRRKA